MLNYNILCVVNLISVNKANDAYLMVFDNLTLNSSLCQNSR